MAEPAKAVFLSYAREDAAAAKRIAEALRAFGVEVWFDQSELRGGDQWDQKIRGQIKACGLFIPVISATTQARDEAYFRLEWKLADDRSHLMAPGKAFIVPVVIDATAEEGAAVPDSFSRAQWTRVPGGQPSAEFLALVKRLALGTPSDAARPRPGAPAPVAPAPPAARNSAPPIALAIGLGTVAVSVALIFVVLRRDKSLSPTAAAPSPVALVPAPAPPQMADQSVAVLPFANLSGDPAQEYFSDGLTEEILNTLARERDLRVPGRASAFSFKGKNVSSAEIAKALNVSRLVEGSVRRAGNKVRINVSLTRTADGFSEELGTFTEEVTDIFALQDKVARAVVEKLTRRTATTAAVGLTKNAEAYDAYLKGRALQTRAANNTPEAIKAYEQAVALDPTFALAWARLAEARFRAYGAMTDRSPEVVEGTRTAIDRALAAQPDLPEALIVRANWLRAMQFDFTAAQRDLARAESLQPATADLRFGQATLARDQDNWLEALRLAREALRLDPQNGDSTNAFAVAFCMVRGELVEADALFRRAMAIQGPGISTPFGNLVSLRLFWRGPEAALRLIDRTPPTQAGWALRRAELLVQLGRLEEARVEVDKLEAAAGARSSLAGFGNPNRATPYLLRALGREEPARQLARAILAEAQDNLARGNHSPMVRLAHLRAEIFLGHRESVLAALQEWREETSRIPSTFRRMMEYTSAAAVAYALLGQADEAVAALRELRSHGYLGRVVFAHHPDFAAIAGDAGFQELVRQHEAWTKTQPDPVDL